MNESRIYIDFFIVLFNIIFIYFCIIGIIGKMRIILFFSLENIEYIFK